jgi:hypothetical protein
MGIGPGSGFGSFVQGAAQGADWVGDQEQKRMQRQLLRDRVNESGRQSAAAQDEFNAASQIAQQRNPGQTLTTPKSYQSGVHSLVDPVMNKIKTWLGARQSGVPQVGHAAATPSAQGPAGPTYNPQPSPSPAQSAPGPESSAPGQGGQLGVGSSQTQPDDSWRLDQNGQFNGYGGPRADGGMIGKKTGVTPPTGIKPRPMRPRNTEARPSMPGGTDQGGPMFDDGGPVNRPYPPANPAYGNETVSLNGKPHTVSGDPDVKARALAAMQRLDSQADDDSANRAAGKGIPARQYAKISQQKGSPQKLADGGPPSADADVLARAAANRARTPGQLPPQAQTVVNDTTAKPAGLEPAEAAEPGEATSAAADAGSRTGRALAKGKGLAKSLGRGGVAVGALGGAGDALRTSTEDYANRFGLDTPNSVLGEVGVRALGAASDVGNNMTFGGLQKVHDTMYPDMPWGGPGGKQPAPLTPTPASQGNGLEDVQPTGQRLPVPSGPAASKGKAQPGGEQTVPQSNAPIDFSKVDVDHSEIPNTSSQDWDNLKALSVRRLVANGMPITQATVTVDDQVSDYQHRQFMQMMQQGIALDRAGNKKGAMAAYRTAYQYMPTGHDVKFGLAPDGTIIGFGIDEKTGQPVGQPVKLDQKNVNGLLATYQDPNNFMKELEGYQGMQVNKQKAQAEIGLMGHQGNYYEAHGEYMRGANESRLAAAMIRNGGKNAGLAPDVTMAIERDRNLNMIPDPNDQFEARGVASYLAKTGMDVGSAVAIAGRMYSGMSREQRAQFAQKHGIPLPDLVDGAGAGYPAGMGGGYYGNGIPPR